MPICLDCNFSDMVDLKSLLNKASISTPGIMQQMEPMELT